MVKKRIVGICGLGHVGAHVAYSLGLMGIADEVRLYDLKEKKLISECNDLNDAAMFLPNRTIYKVVDPAGMKDCDVIVDAIGDIELCKSFNRDSELENSVIQVSEMIPKIMAGGFNGIFVNITNPCDVITRLIAKLSGLPKGRVLGTGTMLDTARLVHQISKFTGLDSRAFSAMMIGEHGNAQMAVWSHVNFYGRTLPQMEETLGVKLDRDEIRKDAIQGGWVTMSGKWCTEYGIAAAAATMVRTILHDEKRILPCSAPLDGEYGATDIFAGVPAIIGKDGVEKVLELDLTEAEKADFATKLATIAANVKKGEAILAAKNAK